MTLSQIFGNLNLWASLPAALLYYLFVTSFEYDDPEGRITDTTVRAITFPLIYDETGSLILLSRRFSELVFY